MIKKAAKLVGSLFIVAVFLWGFHLTTMQYGDYRFMRGAETMYNSDKCKKKFDTSMPQGVIEGVSLAESADTDNI